MNHSGNIQIITLVSLLGVILILMFAGCQKPNEVELTNDALEIETVVDSEPTLSRTSIDSTALLPKDEDRFEGRIFLNSVTNHTANGIESVVYSRIVFEDRNQPVIVDGRKHGYVGLLLRSIELNGDSMRARLRMFRNAPGGVEYFKVLPSYQPRRLYTWQLVSLLRDTSTISIQSPNELRVLSPAGGARIARNQDLPMQWIGQGDLFIIISRVVRESNVPVVKPLFGARVRNNAQRAVLGKKFLKALPPAEAYVFTFVLANRAEKQSLGRFDGRVLVQASSIYNSYVTLQ